MQQIEPLNYGKFYHIYNRGINSCDLFYENTNYEYFLGLYDKHISHMANTYAWVLMKNHFHLLVRIKEEVDIQPRTTNLTGLKTINRIQQKGVVPPDSFSVHIMARWPLSVRSRDRFYHFYSPSAHNH